MHTYPLIPLSHLLYISLHSCHINIRVTCSHIVPHTRMPTHVLHFPHMYLPVHIMCYTSLLMCIYLHHHVCVHLPYLRKHTYIYIYLYIHTCTHIYPSFLNHVHVHTLLITYLLLACTITYLPACDMSVYVSIYLQFHIRTYLPSPTYMHIHIHTYHRHTYFLSICVLPAHLNYVRV